jgi:hypothetical protein
MINTQLNMNTSTNPNIVIRDLECFTKRNICPSADKSSKLKAVARAINPTKYNIIGLVDRSNHVILETRFHNVRDSRGRFARVVGNRRSR